MQIPNCDQGHKSNLKQVKGYEYMSKDTFPMLIGGPSGSGKTTQLLNIVTKPLICYDKIYLNAQNFEQD